MDGDAGAESDAVDRRRLVIAVCATDCSNSKGKSNARHKSWSDAMMNEHCRRQYVQVELILILK
jgi:hypothetical protein